MQRANINPKSRSMLRCTNCVNFGGFTILTCLYLVLIHTILWSLHPFSISCCMRKDLDRKIQYNTTSNDLKGRLRECVHDTNVHHRENTDEGFGFPSWLQKQITKNITQTLWDQLSNVCWHFRECDKRLGRI